MKIPKSLFTFVLFISKLRSALGRARKIWFLSTVVNENADPRQCHVINNEGPRSQATSLEIRNLWEPRMCHVTKISQLWQKKCKINKIEKFVKYFQSDYHRNLRRTVMRYVNLSTILVFRLVSAKVHARFPDYNSMVRAKILLPHEKRRLDAIDERTPHETTYMPILWAMNLLQKARTDGKIKVEPPIYSNMISAFDYLEDCNRKIFNHGWVNFPLAYTQVRIFYVKLLL